MVALLSPAAAARPGDVDGWQRARWGMTAAEIDNVYSNDLSRLRQPLLFGGAYADRSLATRLAGVPFLALFQMTAGNHRLQQVMLETRAPQATPAAHRNVARHLADAYGPADATCMREKAEGEPMLVESVWRFATTTVHASFIDFSTTAVFSEAPFPHRLTQPSYERRRNHWRTMPRRIVVRFHASGRGDLMGDCRPDRIGDSLNR